MKDSPDTTNDSSMTEKSMEQQLWNRYSIASDNDRKFVDAKILDEIAEKGLANKYRTVQRPVSDTNRSRLEITGFKSFIPSPRHIRRATAGIVVQFTNFCKPEKDFLASKQLRFFH